ncbi:MAG TPA: hypothetical protein VG890_06250 [Puia sp.]|nr:hypothetical protein [Puia sp.]
MGSQKGVIVRATVGNVIYYALDGKGVMRSKPNRIRQTSATVKTGQEFGKASRLGKHIRSIVKPINPCRDDRKVMFRLTGTLNLLVHRRDENPASPEKNQSALAYLDHFQFNKDGAYSCLERIEMEPKLLDNRRSGLQFSSFIPSRIFGSVPSDTTKIYLRVQVIAAEPDRCTAHLLGEADWQIPFGEEPFSPEDLDFKTSAEPGNLLLTVAAAEYERNRNGNMVIDPRLNFRPCGVIRTEMIF